MPSSTHPRVRLFRALFAASLPAALTLLALPVSAGEIVRTFRFAPHEVRVAPTSTGARVTIAGGVAMGAPGEPEVPAVPVYVEIPAGTKVTAVTFTASGWTAIPSDAGFVRATAAASPGFPIEGSEPDAALWRADAWFPAAAGLSGPSGSLRGRALTSLALQPVRVRPASGAVELATTIEVRLRTAPDAGARSVRKRVVPEWEELFDAGSPRFGRGGESLTPAWEGARIERAGASTRSGGGGFAPTVVPSVEGSPVQYLILTNAVMQPELQRLADWRTRTGVPTVVRTVEFIESNYPYGFDLQDRIRRFVREAYEQWGITHLLLAGDTDVIPPRYGRTTFFGGASIPTDLYYSDLDRNWNADGDSLFGEAYQEAAIPGDDVDLMPDIYVGRAPITTLAQAQTFVDKTLQYSRTPVGDYENKALFAGEVLFPQDWVPPASISLDGAEDCESAISRLTPEMSVLRLYENYQAYSSVGALQETRQRVLDSLNIGRGLFHHVGHGYRNSMSVGDAAITNPDAEALANGDRTWLLYSINCTSNAIDFASLGEAFVLNPNGGAVANIGSTREDFPVTGRSYQDEFYDLVFQDKVETVGEAFARQKFPFVGLAYYDNTHRWTQFTLNLLGDPALPLYWRKPPTLTVTAPANVPLSDTTFVVNVQIAGSPVDTARVCLLKAGEVYEVVETDALGNATLHVRPETAGSAYLTVSAVSARPYEGTVNFTPASGIVLVQRAADRTVDDDASGGTVGAGDGAADAGETIDWLLPITNSGGTTAGSVTATLSSTSPHVTVIDGATSYGSIFGGITVPGTPYRIQIAENVPDGTEVLFRLDMFSGGAHWVDEFRLPIRAPLLVHVSNTVVDNGTNGTIGNGNGRLDVGETVDVRVTLRNTTTGTARSVTGALSTSTPGASVTGGAATFGDVPANTSATSTAFRVVNSSASDPRFLLTVSDAYGVRFTQLMDMILPGGITSLLGTGAASSITLGWKPSLSADVAGYNVYRASAPAGPFTRLNAIPTDRTALYVDNNLPALTRFYYQVSAVDSSGNESVKSPVSSASTNPPLAAGFPLVTERNMPSSPAIANIDNSSDSSYEIVAGSNVLWAWHADGTAVRDADGTERTSGDFTTLGSYYAAGATIADLDLDGTWEIIAPTWDDKKLYVFRADGSNFPGFPLTVGSSSWSTPAAGNIDADPQLEIVFGSNDQKFFAYNHDGTEVRDGDANPATIGVFRTVASAFNYSSPALADLDHDGRLDIVMVTADGLINAWRGDGTSLPGFPVNMFAGGTSSAGVGNIDGDAMLEIAVTSSGGKLWVVQENGTNQPGFPITGLVTSGTSKSSSPALADMDGDGQRDVVINTADGLVKVYKGTGALVPGWSFVRYSTTAGASESSPVVADIDGDGQNEVLIGGEDANLYAFDNDGTLMAGFPIHLNGEVRGTPTVWDIDHDGMTEILLSCWDKNVYMWDYDFPFNATTAAPAWPMWRHDVAHHGRADAPIVVAAEAVAFAAEDGPGSGLALSFLLPQAATAAGSYDVYRASGAGPTGVTSPTLPSSFGRVSAEPLAGMPGDLLRYTDASALPGETYRYLLVRRPEAPGETFLAFGPFAAIASAEAPAVAFLAPVFPNPAGAGQAVSISYGVPGDGAATTRATVRLYDVRGRLVRSIVDESVPPGRYQATWDGRDAAGARVAPGVYFYEYVVGARRLRQKALVLGR